MDFSPDMWYVGHRPILYRRCVMTDMIDVFTHSCIRIRSDRGVIYVDPFQMRDELHDADYIFITHEHYDHFSPDDIAMAGKEGTVLVVPESMKAKAENAAGGNTVITVRPGTSFELDAFSFEAVPAYNRLKPFHPRGAGWLGYVFDIDGERIYVAGDTDLTVESRQVRCDIALVPVGGTYTMNAKQAAELVNAIHPSTAIPTHYGGPVGKENDAEEFAALVDPSIKVEIKKQY